MKTLIILTGIFINSLSFAGSDKFMHKETIKCGNESCSIICHEPSARWNSYLQSKGNLEITYFHNSGNRQIKADMGNDKYTILDTNPSFQSCKITGVIK